MYIKQRESQRVQRKGRIEYLAAITELVSVSICNANNGVIEFVILNITIYPIIVINLMAKNIAYHGVAF